MIKDYISKMSKQITDMTMNGASKEEIKEAVEESIRVIDKNRGKR